MLCDINGIFRTILVHLLVSMDVTVSVLLYINQYLLIFDDGKHPIYHSLPDPVRDQLAAWFVGLGI